jgi:hypothetical protein
LNYLIIVLVYLLEHLFLALPYFSSVICGSRAFEVVQDEGYTNGNRIIAMSLLFHIRP